VWYGGKIVACKKEASRIPKWDLRIRYDDGEEEQTTYPDPDVQLVVGGGSPSKKRKR
jgi:hypothetical protein